MPDHFRLRLEQAIRQHDAGGRTVSLFRHYRMGWAAAILLLVSVGGYLLYQYRVAHPAEMARAKATPGDAPPGTTKAILTLADGRKVAIDSTRSGELAVQGSTKVQQANGIVVYNGNNNTNGQKKVDALIYNTLTTGRGEQSPALTLSDGTKVWLNALSSIRFPVVFTGSTRQVEISGEAFFEVAKNTAMPFHVTTGGMDVEVLGTQFNINAYSDEPDMRTSLLEGRVRITSRAGKPAGPLQSVSPTLVLEPGQQARAGDGLSLVDHPDIDRALAWRRGLFDFNHADLQTVMRQLSRWYDVSVRFEGKATDRFFHGKITRDLKLSQTLDLLRDVDIRYRMEGKTLIVTCR
jgi:ferric-dicitrate binding protein FerR (iron transport regulator)